MECMIDIETLSTENNAVVISLGAALFKFGEELKAYEIKTFSTEFDIKDQVKRKRDISTDTIAWWLTQDKTARVRMARKMKGEYINFLIDGDAISHNKFWLIEFKNFCTENKVSNLWGNGSTFDNIIMRDMFKMYDVLYPVGYRNDRDLRTLYDQYIKLTGKIIPYINHGVAHDAVDDAISQALTAQKVYKELETQMFVA